MHGFPDKFITKRIYVFTTPFSDRLKSTFLTETSPGWKTLSGSLPTKSLDPKAAYFVKAVLLMEEKREHAKRATAFDDPRTNGWIRRFCSYLHIAGHSKIVCEVVCLYNC